MRRFVFAEGSSNKFWEITVTGDETIVCFGKIGTAGRTVTKRYDSPAMAAKAAESLIEEKTKKGYTEELASRDEGQGQEASAQQIPAPAASAAAEGVEPRRFVFQDGKAGKLWELEVRGSQVVIGSGKAGGEVQTTTKLFPSEDAAEAEAVALVKKQTGEQTDEYFQEEAPPPPYPYEFGDRYWDVGAHARKLAVHFGKQTRRSQTPVTTWWTRFATPAGAKAAEQRIRDALDKAVDDGVLPDPGAIAKLLAPAASEEPLSSCRECARLAAQGARAPSLSSSSTELSFTQYATPLLMAGKLLVVGVTADVLRELCERVDAFAQAHDQRVALVAHAPPSWPAEGVMGRELVLGRLVAVGNHHELSKLSLPEMRQALADAGKLPWAELLALVSDPRLESPRDLEWESLAEPDDDVRLRVFATGPLASGMVGFGVPMRDGESEAIEVVPGLDEVWGQDMDQKRLPQVVYGEYAGICDFHDNEGPDTVDVSAPAHKARTSKLDALAKKAAYYLVGRYD